MTEGLRAVMAALLLLPFLAVPGGAETRDRAARMVTEAEAPAYLAVGRLNVAGNRHCTATLISNRLVLTAAHCLFNPLTGRRAAPADLHFVAGQRGETYAARRGVSGVATLPGYVFRRLPGRKDAARDLALLQLDAPIGPGVAVPLPTGQWDGKSPVSLVAFGRNRAYIASLSENCRRQSAMRALVVLDCPAVPGVSGAPVLRAGPSGPEVVGVVSAAMDGKAWAITVVLTPALIETLKRTLLGAPV